MSAAVRGRMLPHTGLVDLEHELQPELHHAAASRTDERIAGRDIGRVTAAAEKATARVIA